MSRWVRHYITLGEVVVFKHWNDEKIIEETAHHWARLGVPMDELHICYFSETNTAPKLVRKSDLATGKLVINNDHPMKWFYDRVENEDE